MTNQIKSVHTDIKIQGRLLKKKLSESEISIFNQNKYRAKLDAET